MKIKSKTSHRKSSSVNTMRTQYLWKTPCDTLPQIFSQTVKREKWNTTHDTLKKNIFLILKVI